MTGSLKSVAIVCLASALPVVSAAVSAAEQVIEEVPILVSVENRTMEGGTRYKFTGCLAKLPANTITLNGCNTDYIMFGCDGSVGIPKAQAKTAFDAANLAFVTGLPLKARVTDQANMDGVCLAVNTQVAAAP